MVGFHDATWQNDSSSIVPNRTNGAEATAVSTCAWPMQALHDCIKVGLCVVVHS